ncbi:MAG TPA: AraC family transcriptional regulator [Blastocatellia bacterium]|nr:AraC family transcriptional regulator [Blastocatellia bacterium]
MNPKVELAISFLQANLHRAITVADIAQSVELSTSRFSGLFKTEVGVSPFQYLKNARLERARKLLETTLLNIKVVAAEVGYNDCSHFMREFKKAYDSTPTEYRDAYLSRNRKENLQATRPVGLASKQ